MKLYIPLVNKNLHSPNIIDTMNQQLTNQSSNVSVKNIISVETMFKWFEKSRPSAI